jgi:hypothetical protein
VWVGAGLCVLALVALLGGATRPPGASMVVLHMLAVPLALGGLGLFLWGLAYRRLAYHLTHDGLEVSWLGECLLVPYTAIDGIYTGQRLVGHTVPRAPRWPGIYVGPGRVRGMGRLRFFATSPDPAALTLITWTTGGLVVSASSSQDFRSALIERVVDQEDKTGPSVYVRRAVHEAPWTTLHDRWFPWCLGAGLGLLVLGFVVVVLGYNALPEQIPLRFDATGRPTQIGPRSDLLHLPVIGLIGLLANCALGVWLHPRERLLARLLWVGAAIMQAVLLVAVIRLLQ